MTQKTERTYYKDVKQVTVEFRDGTKVWFMAEDVNQMGPGVDPATSQEMAVRYIRAALAYLGKVA